MVAHQSIVSAVAIALEIQHKLHHFDWGTTRIDEIYCELTDSSTIYNTEVWNGLRIRVGIAYGTCDGQVDPITGGWDYYGTTVNTAARVEAAAHGGQVIVTGPAYRALLPEESRDLNLAKNPVPRPENMQDLGIEHVSSHGPVALRGLGEPTELVEITPNGFSDRKFPPLRVEESALEGADELMEEGEQYANVHHDSPDTYLLGHLPPQFRMEQLMKMCIRETGVHRYDSKFLESSMSIFFSLKALLSLHSTQERSKVLNDWTKRWHLSVPPIGADILETIGGPDIPKLLVLATRAATVVQAEKRPLLNASSRSLASAPGMQRQPVSAGSHLSARNLLASFKEISVSQPARFFAAKDHEETEETNLEDISEERSATSC